MKSNMFFSVGPKKDTPREHYRVDKHGIAYMKQNVRALQGKYVIMAYADEFWCANGFTSKSYTSKVLENPTWGQLFACAKAAQRKTGDLHHAFFEGVRLDHTSLKVNINGEDVPVLHLTLGS
jgi:hypothetical protein